jgi:hypothetical protein
MPNCRRFTAETLSPKQNLGIERMAGSYSEVDFN